MCAGEPLSVEEQAAVALPHGAESVATDDLESLDADTPREIVELQPAEAMRLLASVGYGRVVFSFNALPAIRLVNHIVEGGLVIVRTRLTAAVSQAVRSGNDSAVVVAYEADDVDAHRRVCWSVVVTGRARTVTDPVQVDRYERLLRPWVNKVIDTVIAIEPEIVTGLRIGCPMPPVS